MCFPEDQHLSTHARVRLTEVAGEAADGGRGPVVLQCMDLRSSNGSCIDKVKMPADVWCALRVRGLLRLEDTELCCRS